jgi:Lipoyl protein ligase A/B catalytic domain
MPTLGLVVEPLASSDSVTAADRAALARATARGHGSLRISQLAGDVLSLGRWHLAPGGGGEVGLQRRLTGGRAAASGAGFVRISIALPHRSALTAADPLALAPEQVLNRAVRGLLDALEGAGLPAIYPGRDQVTVGGKPIAALGLEVDEAGATLIDAVLSVERDQSLLPHFLERADPAGVVTAPLIGPDDVTSMARGLGSTPSFDELVARIRRGYERRLGVTFVSEEPPAVGGDDGAFVRTRVVRPELDRRGRSAIMLGTLEVHCALGDDLRLRDVLLAGDLLAPSRTMTRLEAVLGGLVPRLDVVAPAIERVVRQPGEFVLGVHPLATIAETIVRAVR